jgi:dipeptidyl aminopeptidase/acylaminoacyl peptidase
MTRIALLFAVSLAQAALPLSAQPLRDYRPSPEQLAAARKRAGEWESLQRKLAPRLSLTPHWLDEGRSFWYLERLPEDRKLYWRVASASGKREPAFDHARLAQALAAQLGKAAEGDKLPFDEIAFAGEGKLLRFEAGGKRWEADLDDYELRERPAAREPERGRRDPDGPRRIPSPDGKWVATLHEGKLSIRPAQGENGAFEAKTEGLEGARWSPDSARLVCFRRIHGKRREVYLIRSSSRDSRGQLLSRLYDQPGDDLDTFETILVDPAAGREAKADVEPLWTGGQPWANPPGIEWLPGGREFVLGYAERGYGRYFVDAVDAATGARRRVVAEDPETFFDTTSRILRVLSRTPGILWRSERDGFGRLYLLDAQTGAVRNPVTPAGWIVRSLEWVDEEAGRLCFSANLVDPLLDPYFIHYFTVGLDGSGLIRLTDAPGMHRATFSPDRQVMVASWSRVDEPPVHELRSVSDGKRIALLGRPDLSEWEKLRLPQPETFVAKGRDGKTDIWGVVFRPSHFDPRLRYPVIENIYAGPHDSHVPKSFTPIHPMQRLAELGFIVVQMDGMGTRNRGKAFHDVCYKNIADAGFPDRILWLKALAKKMPQADLERVGIYGTSAGGQSSTGALLFHPDFYKVAVSSCGCHDNRIDKQWWNEQWMGVLGPHYAEQSNVTHAAKLQGKLMLIVGELDTNVPPESTFRLADALIKAEKEFELVVIPGADHTSGGPYGDRKRTDFFVRHLLGVETPNWNRREP